MTSDSNKVESPAGVRCKDCRAEGVQTVRSAPHPGPRCATHHRLEKKRRSQVAHGRHVEKTYGITGEEYDYLYQQQNGKCAICQRATGARKRLAVDHNHETGAVRGLLCGPCNFDLIGKYDAVALMRAIIYLRDEPAQGLLVSRKERS